MPAEGTLRQRRPRDPPAERPVGEPPAVGAEQPVSIVGLLFPLILLVSLVFILLVVGVVWPWKDRGVADSPLNVVDLFSRLANSDPLPPSSTFHARDTTQLSFRRYPGPQDDPPCVIVAVHTLGLDGRAFHSLVTQLRTQGSQCAAFVPDMRGHGQSNIRRRFPGTLSNPSQPRHDLEDFLQFIATTYPRKPLHVLAHGTAASLTAYVPLPDGASLTMMSPLFSFNAQHAKREVLARHLQLHSQRLSVLTLLNMIHMTWANWLPVAYMHFSGARPPPRLLTYTELLGYLPTVFRNVARPSPARDLANRTLFVLVGADDQILHESAPTHVVRFYRTGTTAVIPHADHHGILLREETAKALHHHFEERE